MTASHTTTFTPSEYQRAIFAAMADSDSLIIEAVAGSGKTTTIVECASLLPPTAKAVFLAFNKSIATELSERLPITCPASTFHALYLRAITATGRVKIEGNKTWGIIRNAVNAGQLSKRDSDTYGSTIVRLVSIAKNAGIGALTESTPEAWQELVNHHDIDVDGGTASRLIELAMIVLDVANDDTRTIDFDDMLYNVVRLGLPVPQHDVIFVDEAQDTNVIQRELLSRSLKAGGRVIAVGDPYQAIYGFRGADSDAMDLIATQFNARRMPLTVSYRCPQDVVTAARRFVDHIESAPNAPKGSVITPETWELASFAANDAVICRTTAPIIGLAYRLIANRTPVKVLGREIGQGLITVIRKLAKNATTMTELASELDAWEANESGKALAKNDEAKAQAIYDKADSITAAIDAVGADATIDALIASINALFNDTANAVTLSTVHKAKGLEWNRVIVLDYHKMPATWARQPWQQKQERNIAYVAYTRAKDTLVLLDSERIS